MTSKTRRTQKRRALTTIHAGAAGLDVGATFHVVAVPPDRADESVRTFRSFTGDLHVLADWLKQVGVTTIAMESTGVYWIPVFEILEGRGFEVLLVNARDVKNVPGGRPTSPTRSGCSSCTSTDCFVEASTLARSKSKRLTAVMFRDLIHRKPGSSG